MSALLVVTASRCLDDTPEARAWAVATIAAALDARPWTHVITGGAPMRKPGRTSPDVWAEEMAARRGMRWVRYALDGRVYRCGKPVRRWTEAKRVDPLDRNREIVAAARRALVDPDTAVYCVGARAPWATTDGTGHTARLFWDARIPAWLATCPAEYRPGDWAIGPAA